MITLIIGKSNTGKSALAEKLALETGDDKVYYLATMKVMDEAGRERVVKHRKQREGKGFITIEKEKDISGIWEEFDLPEKSTVLLECVANLVSNEMFDNPLFDTEGTDKKTFCDSLVMKLAKDIKDVSERTANLLIVTNEYDKDCEGYDDATRLYVNTIHRVNEEIKKFTDKTFDLLEDKEGI